MKQRSLQLASKVIEYLKELRDIRVLGVHVFVLIALLVTWSGVGVIQDNYKLQKQIVQLQQETELQNLENATLRLRNEFYNTDQYLELTARRQFRLAAPGEKMLLVPESVALAHSTDIPEESPADSEKVKPQKPAYQRNFEAWMQFIFHRQSS